MSAPPTKTKPASRWGNFFTGAVEGLESRLDKILAEENTRAAKNLPPRQPPLEKKKLSAEPSADAEKDSLEANNTGSAAKIENENVEVTGDVARLRPSSLRTQSNSPAPSEQRTRTSFESTQSDAFSASQPRGDGKQVEDGGAALEDQGTERNTGVMESSTISQAEHSIDPSTLDGNREEVAVASSEWGEEDQVRHDEGKTDALEVDLSPAEYRAQISQWQEDAEKAELARQEEVHAQMERIDALNSKLHYLAREAAEAAKKASAEAPSGSPEKKLAAKDEQIALLMEEGQKLSKTEVSHAATIRKLRIKMSEDAKASADMKRKWANAEKSSTEMFEKIARLEASQKENASKLIRISRMEREIEELKIERDSKQSIIEKLRTQVKEASAKADEEGKRAMAEALATERKTAQSLQDDLANAQIERQLAEDRLRAEVKAVKEESAKEQEKANTKEQRLRNEISILEGRMEVFRTRTEEASSGVSGDTQAKLMRQVETLQSQYAVASENWQGIESSLGSRITALEKERDDALKQETEARRKARETSNASRRLEEQVDELSRKSQVLEHELGGRRGEAEKLQSRAAEFEKNLQDAQAELERERNAWHATLATKIEEEKVKWKQESNQFMGPEIPMAGPMDSPLALSRKISGLELPLAMRKNASRHRSTELNIPETDKAHSRRSSAFIGLGLRAPDIGSPSGHITSPSAMESGFSTPILNGHLPETPSLNEADQDDPMETSSSPQRTINDMFSASTAGAGPSVQLVERMSAAVRRLESEKAASKEELARFVAQRDEARKEVVSLMREVEEKREADAKIKKLETDITGMGQRYQTTLEMLGEKSERVDELTADVADLKKIYRELVESTVK